MSFSITNNKIDVNNEEKLLKIHHCGAINLGSCVEFLMFASGRKKKLDVTCKIIQEIMCQDGTLYPLKNYFDSFDDFECIRFICRSFLAVHHLESEKSYFEHYFMP